MERRPPEERPRPDEDAVRRVLREEREEIESADPVEEEDEEEG
jgi:hypothetical protein